VVPRVQQAEWTINAAWFVTSSLWVSQRASFPHPSAGTLLVQRDVHPSDKGTTYYRKALVTKMSSPSEATGEGGRVASGSAGGKAHLPRLIRNSEARQREALEIADRIHPLHVEDRDMPQGELSGGGGSVGSALPKEDLEPLVDAQQPVLGGEAPQTPPAGAQPVVPQAPEEGDAPAGASSRTAIVSQVFSNGEMRELVVDTARLAFLDVMSKGLESEDLESKGPVHKLWWTNLVSAHGDVVPRVERPLTGPTAALATAQSLSLDARDHLAPVSAEDEQCKIAVIDVGKDLGPSLGTRPCDLSFKRVWPFSRHKHGIDGVETLFPEHYQYAAEYWISQSIRNSSRYVDKVEDADFVFVDMWCYHMAWLAYIHPLGNRNTTNVEPYMRRTLNAIVNSQK